MGDGREAVAASLWAASHAGRASAWPLSHGQCAGSSLAAGESSIGTDRISPRSPAFGADSDAGAARRFHKHLHLAAMEFEKMLAEKAAMSAKLRSLQKLPVAAAADQPPSSRRGKPQPKGSHLVLSHAGSHAHAYAMPPPPILREVHVADSHVDAPPSVTGAESDVICCVPAACADSYASEQGCGGEVPDNANLSSRAPELAGSKSGHGGEDGREHSHDPGVQATPSHGSHAEVPALALPERAVTASSPRSATSAGFRRTSTIALHAEGAGTATDDDWDEEEPPEDNPSTCRAALLPIVSSPHFDSLTCCAIVMNAICLAFQMQYDGMVLGCSLELAEYSGMDPDRIWPWASSIFHILDIAFNAFFCLELFLRVLLYRGALFRSVSNWLDIAIVCLGVLSSVAPIGNITVARLLRLTRLSRMRVLKMNEWVDSLRLILTSIVKSQPMMFWSIVLMVVVQSIVGLIMNSILFLYLENPDNDLEARQNVFYYYGTFTRTMISLFEVHFANWSPACRVLFDNIGPYWAVGFVFYRCVVGFSLLNVIGAVFIQTTMKAAQNATDSKILVKQQEQRQHAAELMSFFETLDTSKDGFVSWEELQQVADKEYYRHWLAALEIEPYDLHAIFKALDFNGDGLVAPQELIINAARIKGHAKRVDVVDILAHIKIVEAKLDHVLPAPQAKP